MAFFKCVSVGWLCSVSGAGRGAELLAVGGRSGCVVASLLLLCKPKWVLAGSAPGNSAGWLAVVSQAAAALHGHQWLGAGGGVHFFHALRPPGKMPWHPLQPLLANSDGRCAAKM